MHKNFIKENKNPKDTQETGKGVASEADTESEGTCAFLVCTPYNT